MLTSLLKSGASTLPILPDMLAMAIRVHLRGVGEHSACHTIIACHPAETANFPIRLIAVIRLPTSAKKTKSFPLYHNLLYGIYRSLLPQNGEGIYYPFACTPKSAACIALHEDSGIYFVSRQMQ